ncbi:hypothetical protein O3P69_000690 [Scylla paramamosain]|uniref:Uncharacterized protein n=1 Tax=Scylla paramamosain TaxID=85552 RepID=A0AAW0UTB1_SCYPA
MTVDGLAVWIHGNIYFIDISANKLQMISWDGYWTCTIVTDKLDLPRATTVNAIDSDNNEDATMVDTLLAGLLPLPVFGSPSSSTSSSQKMVIEVLNPQAGMMLGVVLDSLVVLDRAVGLLGGLLKLLYY